MSFNPSRTSVAKPIHFTLILLTKHTHVRVYVQQNISSYSLHLYIHPPIHPYTPPSSSGLQVPAVLPRPHVAHPRLFVLRLQPIQRAVRRRGDRVKVVRLQIQQLDPLERGEDGGGEGGELVVGEVEVLQAEVGGEEGALKVAQLVVRQLQRDEVREAAEEVVRDRLQFVVPEVPGLRV